MFERFSEQARRALFFAREEASQLGSIRIDTEHYTCCSGSFATARD